MGFPPLAPSQTHKQTRVPRCDSARAKPGSVEGRLGGGQLCWPQRQRGTRVCLAAGRGLVGEPPFPPRSRAGLDSYDAPAVRVHADLVVADVDLVERPAAAGFEVDLADLARRRAPRSPD